MVVAYFVLISAAGTIVGNLAQEGAPTEPTAAEIGLLYGLSGIFVLVYAVLFAPYHAAVLRSVTAGISFDGARFRMQATWLDLAWLSLSNVALVTISLGFLMPFVQARTSKFLIGRLQPSGSVDFSTIHQVADAGPRTGEGLADAFGTAAI
jgi:uncharacterized membrane protein YjgN (DUF898 family)